jgi:hypothetical protein
MQHRMVTGLDVHKATISVAVAQGERGGEIRHWGTVLHRPDLGLPRLSSDPCASLCNLPFEGQGAFVAQS